MIDDDEVQSSSLQDLGLDDTIDMSTPEQNDIEAMNEDSLGTSTSLE